jgi:hypothetical protein
VRGQLLGAVGERLERAGEHAAVSRDGNGAGSGQVEHTHARPDMGSG